MSDNIELFDLYAAKIFTMLYEAFPRRISLEAYGITGLTESEDDFLQMPREVDICRECIWWLERAGFIWCDSQLQTGALQVVLSPKGLEVLKLVPSSLETKVSVGETLVSLGKSGAIETGKGVISAALTEAFRWLSS